MPTALSVTHDFAASPEVVHAKLIDRAFLEGRLEATGGLDPAVVRLDTSGDETTVVSRQSIPSSALPSMVAAMIPGDPVTERTEVWRPTPDGFDADLNVVIKGAPASLKGTITLRPATGGSVMSVQGAASVPIPLFGTKVEQIVVEQVTELLNREATYTASALTS